jgi:hypothetical protein
MSKYNDDDFDFVNVNIGSQSECTGSVPTVPLDEAQQEGYSDVFSVPQQIGTSATKSKNAKEQERKSSKKTK